MLAKSPSRIEPFVPSLLGRLADGAVYQRFWSGGGLIGFGEAGEREVSVAQVALAALRKSRPAESSVTPIVRAMVANANRMSREDGVGLYGDPGTAAMALAGLLTREYRQAGLGAVVDAALERELPGIRRAQVRQSIEASLYPVAATAPVAPARRELRTTAPVAGRGFSGRAAADAHCSAAFGPGWRMAEHHDGDWGLGARGTPPAPQTRFWVAIRDQPGNCWDSR